MHLNIHCIVQQNSGGLGPFSPVFRVVGPAAPIPASSVGVVRGQGTVTLTFNVPLSQGNAPRGDIVVQVSTVADFSSILLQDPPTTITPSSPQPSTVTPEISGDPEPLPNQGSPSAPPSSLSIPSDPFVDPGMSFSSTSAVTSSASHSMHVDPRSTVTKTVSLPSGSMYYYRYGIANDGGVGSWSSVLPVVVGGTAVYVSTGGSDSGPGTEQSPYRSLARALQQNFGVIDVFMSPGTYVEQTMIIRCVRE